VTGSANVIGANPQLVALAFNGGPTRTHALLAGSPAIDSGSNPFALQTDQRGDGFARVSGSAADMGAYEGSVAVPPGSPAITGIAPASIRRNQRTPVQITGTGLAGASVNSADSTLLVSAITTSSTRVDFNIDVPAAAALGPRNFDVANGGGHATATLQVVPALTLSVLPATIALLPDNLNHGFTLQLSEASPFAQSFLLAAVDSAVLRVVTTVVTVPANALQASFTLAGRTTGTTQLLITPTGGDEPASFAVLVGVEANAANSVQAAIVGIARGDPTQGPGGTPTHVIATPLGLVKGDPTQAPGGTPTQVIATPLGLVKGDPTQAPGGTSTQVIATSLGLAKGDPTQVPGGTSAQVIATSLGLAKGDPTQVPGGTSAQVIATSLGLAKGDPTQLPGGASAIVIARPVGLNHL